jgi:hypothetical protein
MGFGPIGEIRVAGLLSVQNTGGKIRQKYCVLGWTHPDPETSRFRLEMAFSGRTIRGPVILSGHPEYNYRLYLRKL